MQMKMSAFPLPVAGFPNIATTQLLMSAAGGLNLPPPNVSSPKDLPNVSPTSVAGLAGVTRVPGMPGDLSIATGHPPTSSYHLHPQLAANMPPGMLDPRVLYSALNGGYDMKENTDAFLAWRQIAAQAQQAASAGVLSYDAHAAAMAAASLYPSYPPMDLNGARRKNATRETTSTLKAWLYEHRKNPYPTKGEKIMLAIITKMTLTQVSTWFANARRRLKKENKMTWSPRNRTDDGSSVDDEDKVDNEDGVVGDDDDDVSIDLSDFETENNSPQKQSTSAFPSTMQNGPTTTVTPQSSASSPDTDSNTGSSKPRIWSIADVAANKPNSSSTHNPMHHQSSSVRHRAYPIPNSTAFRPWFDNSYRQLAGHPAAVLSNPLLSGSRPTTTSSLRVPHLSSTSTNSTVSHSATAPSTPSPSSSDNATADRTIKSESAPSRKRVNVQERCSPPHSKVSKLDHQER